MKKNMGNMDKVIRVLIALVIGVLVFAEVLTGTLAIVLLTLAGMFVLTSVIGTCPLYLPFGASTCKKED